MENDIDELNSGLVTLLDAMQSESMSAAKVRFSIIGFGSTAICRLPLSDLRNLESMPQLEIHGTTSYAAAFRELRSRIPDDVHCLKGQNYLVNRPAVFFLSDGYPDDEDWRSALADLTAASFSARPNIIAFGIGQAKASIISEVSSRPEYAFIAAKGADTGKAIADFSEALTRSIVNSGQAQAEGRSELIVEKPAEFLAIVTDMV
jgi:uncharacterized protein YegL